MTPPPGALGKRARLGPFEVGARIGGGGMASIHLGRSVLDRGEVVALKIVKSELTRDPRYVDMFRDEAAILSRMDHPNIVRTLEFGVADDRRYIAMELLLGRTLAEVFDAAIEKGAPLDPAWVAWIGARVASALDYAHELVDEHGAPLKIVHRDANPANIVLGYDGNVTLIDFGLAKAARRVARTEDGIVKGKVPYLAPEQILEDEVDARTDVFTLGASLWEILTLRRLFKRETDLETIRAIRDERVPDLAVAAPSCPPALATVVMRALAPTRAERFGSAAELEIELDGVFGRDDDATRAALAAYVERLFPGEGADRARWRTSIDS